MQSKPTEFETNLVFLGVIPEFAKPADGRADSRCLLSDSDVQRLLDSRPTAVKRARSR